MYEAGRLPEKIENGRDNKLIHSIVSIFRLRNKLWKVVNKTMSQKKYIGLDIGSVSVKGGLIKENKENL